jgi:hypothetical protein
MIPFLCNIARHTLVLILLVLSSEGLIDSLVQFSRDIINNQKAMFIHLVKTRSSFFERIVKRHLDYSSVIQLKYMQDMFVF